MTLVLRGQEIVTTEPLGAETLKHLLRLAVRKPLRINGVEIAAEELKRLIEEARQSGQPIWIGDATHAPVPRIKKQKLAKRSTAPQIEEARTIKLAAPLRSNERSAHETKSMRSHRSKVLAHAATRLAGIERIELPEEIAKCLRAFLKIENQRLKIEHRAGAGGGWTAAARGFVLDQVVEAAFRAVTWHKEGSEFLGGAKNGCAVVALGGYGRNELAPHSDLDILFLHTGRRSTQMRQLIERVLRLLWDAGLVVGHSIYTNVEVCHAARTDSHLQTALASTRLIVGNGALYDCLLDALERQRRKCESEFINAIGRERRERYQRHGFAVCLQEPNVKEGAGGLRDLHTALWLAHARYGCCDLNDLRAHDLITESETKTIERAHDFLLRTRCEAHLLTKRKIERLSLDLQPEIATSLGYASDNILLASEKFMRDYYKHARELNATCESIVARLTESERSRTRWFNWQRAMHSPELFSINEGQLQLESGGATFKENPMLLFDAFTLAQAARVTLSHKLQAEIKGALRFVNKEFRTSPVAAAAFLGILRRRGRVGHALRLMHQVGFLEKFLPEFARISLLIQHDLYHHYTIDEHTLKAIDAIDDLTDSQDKQSNHLRAALDEVDDLAVLYLAVLLHDIGKGRGTGHVARGVKITKRVCERLHLNEASTGKVTLLVQHHLTMTHIAQRRDLSEPHVAHDFAREIKTSDNLNMLLLLSYADLIGVAPGVWSDWKGNLLWRLYEQTRESISGDKLPDEGEEQIQLKARVAELLTSELPFSTIERHIALLPNRYTRAFRPEAIADHIRLAEQLEDQLYTCRWEKLNRDATELTLCTRDRHGLFASIAGALTAQGVEILNAELNTREDGIAVDVLILRETATREAIQTHRLAAIEQVLGSALKGEIDLEQQIKRWLATSAPRRSKAQTMRTPKPTQVVCDNDAARHATVVEISTADQHGLAYKLASELTAANLDIVCAKITTEKSNALDVFYVTNGFGAKLAETAMRDLEAKLIVALTPASETSAT